jgi:chromate transporter
MAAGWAGQFDLTAALIAVVAALALIRYQQKVHKVIIVCAVAGLLHRYFL